MNIPMNSKPRILKVIKEIVVLRQSTQFDKENVITAGGRNKKTRK